MDRQVEDIVQAMVDRYRPRLIDADKADNWCLILASELLADLRSASRRAELVWVRRHRRTPQRVPLGPPEGLHALVRVDGCLFVDVTRRQYFPEANAPTLYRSRDELARDWHELRVDEDPEGPYEQL